MVHQLRKPKAAPSPPLTVVWRRIEVLRPHSANPRSHSPKQVSELARSIKTFGFNVPILVDPTLRIIAGHGRLLAAQELGLREVPTILLDHLSPAKARAFTIADNRLGARRRGRRPVGVAARLRPPVAAVCAAEEAPEVG